MESLWGVLGYESAAKQVAEDLGDPSLLPVISGPPGVGKSWLARDIGAVWEAGGGSTVLVEGDVLRSDASMYPFAFAMGGLPSRWSTLGPALAGVARAGELVMGTAGLITTTVQAVAAARRSRSSDRTRFLGESEQVVLYELERLSRKCPLLVIADNLHWWDTSSLVFLAQIRDPRLWEAFPFLAEIRVLGVETTEPYQRVANPVAHDRLLTPTITRRQALPRVPSANFDAVLEALGATPRPDETVARAVHTLCGGHLALAARCAERISIGDADSFLHASTTEEFVRALLTERMGALGDRGKQAMLVLQVAAVLGSTFRRDEVCCAVGSNDRETIDLIRYCRGEGVLEIADGLDRFVHDVYRQFFLSAGAGQVEEISLQLSDCLRRSRPAEYELRCLNAVASGRADEGGRLAIHAALLVERDGRAWSGLPDAVLQAVNQSGMRDTAEALIDALHHLRASRFKDCLQVLDGLPRRLPPSVTAESDFMRAMCLMSTRSEADRASGRRILEGWTGFMEEEPEIGTRLMILLLYGCFHLTDKETGWALETRLTRSLASRVTFDAAAEDAMYTLDRCAGGLHPPDAALVRVRQAVAHFAPANEQSVVRRPGEYYRCLVNLTAKLIENGRFDEACEVGARAEALVARFPEGTFARLDFAHSNVVLANLRAGRLSIRDALGRQERVLERYTPTDDPLFAQNARAVYLALAGRLEDALEAFDQLHAETEVSYADLEPSMVYLLGANRAAVQFLRGERLEAREAWGGLTEVAELSSYMDREVLVLRHRLLSDILGNDDELSITEFDRVLLETGPTRLGPLWHHFGHGFLLPALELWREN